MSTQNINNNNSNNHADKALKLLKSYLDKEELNLMASKLDSTNCLGISFIAEQLNCTTLMEHAVDYTCRHFVDVSQSQEFLQLDADQLGKLLSRDDLHVPSEENVFQSLMAWVSNDEPARKQHIPKLMEKIRLPLLTLSFIKDHVESVCSANDCQHLIIEAYNWQSMPERLLSIARRKTCLLAIGKSDIYLVLESYCPIQKQWTLIKKLQLERLGFGAAVIENKLILVGGGDMINGDLNTMSSLDLKSMTWTPLQPMSTPRRFVTVAWLKGLLYVVGGWACNSTLKTVERWNPQTGTWDSVAPMPTARRHAVVAVLNDCLYVIGGHNGRNEIKCVERYDPCTDEWSCLSPMNEVRHDFGVAQANGLLYAVGGYNRYGPLNSFECYNPTIDKWTKVCSMPFSRLAHGCALFDNRIIVAGSLCSDLTVEEYDPVHNVWNELPSLNTSLRDRSLFVIPNGVINPTANT